MDIPTLKKNGGKSSKTKRELIGWVLHTIAIVIGQIVILTIDQSWAAEQLGQDGQTEGWLYQTGRIWLIVYAIDTLWSWSYVVFPRD
jgi:hypothetical protein